MSLDVTDSFTNLLEYRPTTATSLKNSYYFQESHSENKAEPKTLGETIVLKKQ